MLQGRVCRQERTGDGQSGLQIVLWRPRVEERRLSSALAAQSPEMLPLLSELREANSRDARALPLRLPAHQDGQVLDVALVKVFPMVLEKALVCVFDLAMAKVLEKARVCVVELAMPKVLEKAPELVPAAEVWCRLCPRQNKNSLTTCFRISS